MEILLQLVFSGIALGMIYAVIAFGYQLTFATSGTLNFGQGEALMLGAHVVIENNRPGVMQRLGLDYASLSIDNPALVYCSISAFGQTGPRAQEGGFDLTVQAMSGIMSVTGEADGAPVKCGVPLADFSAGLYAAFSIAAFLRARTGLTERGNGAIHQRRVVDRQRRIIEAQALHHAGAVVFDHHLCAQRQCARSRHVVRVLQVQGDRALVAVQRGEILAVAIRKRLPPRKRC